MEDDNLKHPISDVEQERHNDYNGYRYCPRCREDLVIAEIEETIRPHCRSCGFIFYQNPAPAAGAVIVEDRRILLVQRSIDPRRGDWCIPAGFLEWNEHPQQTAVRELKEETGLDIKTGSIFDIFFAKDDPRTHAVLILYHAKIVGGELTPGDDACDVRFFGFDNLPDNIAFQAHRDAFALYRRRCLGDG